MTDKTRWFNWNGGISLSNTGPSYFASAPAPVSIGFINGHYLAGVHLYNGASVPLFFQLFDVSAAPASGAIPIQVWNMPSNGASAAVDITFAGDGRYFQNGIGFAVSSVGTSLDLASFASLLIDAQYA